MVGSGVAHSSRAGDGAKADRCGAALSNDVDRRVDQGSFEIAVVIRAILCRGCHGNAPMLCLLSRFLHIAKSKSFQIHRPFPRLPSLLFPSSILLQNTPSLPT